jgi:hypothetical protein
VRPLLITTRAELSLEELRAPRRRSSSRERAEPPSPLPLEVAQGSRLRLGGSLRDETGPLGGELVDIEASGGGERRLLGSAVTDFFGHFELTVDKLLLPIGSGFITARLTPTPTPRHRHVRPGPTPELALQVLPPEPLSLLYFLLPLGLSGLGWLLWRGGRLIAARLAAWRLARRQRDGRLSPLAPSSRSPQGPAAAGEAGVTLGSRSPRPTLTLRRTVDSAIDGAVHDAVFGPSLPSASLHILPLASGAPLEDVQVDSQGQFRIAALPAGRYVLRASAPGYLSEEFAATIPHRGELRAITIRLMPLRARIHAEWQRVANAYYSDELRQQTGTPRELLDEATAPRPTAPAATASPLHSPSPAELERLQRLTALVEQSYYSPRLCTKEMLSEAERLAAALSRPGSSPPLTSDPRDGLRAPSAPRPPGPIAPPR